MRCNLKKIIIKYSLILFAFLAVIDGTFALEALPFFDASEKENIPPIAFKMNARVEGDSIQEEEAPAAGQENTDCCVKLQEFGLSRREALSVHLKNNALFIEMRKKERSTLEESPSKFQKTSSQKLDSKFEIDLTLLSPAKMRAFCAEGGDLPKLKLQIGELKTEYPSPIRNIDQFPRSDDHVFSPSVGKSLSRAQLNDARKAGVVKKLFPIAYQKPVDEETEAERLARKEAQERDFLEAERRRGKIPENLHEEIQKELEIWQDYLTYIKLRKNQLFGEEDTEIIEDEDEDEEDKGVIEEKADREEGIKKIRKGEIEDTFFRFVASKLTRLEINGYEVYFTKETLDLDRTDKKVTNWKNMQRGKCPIGPDQKPMNFHHLTHYDYATHKIKSIIVLITQTLHTTYSRSLHFSRTTYRDLPRKKVIRTLFNSARGTFNQAIVATLHPAII